MSCRLFLCWFASHILVLGRWAGRHRNDLSLYLGWRIRSWVGWQVSGWCLDHSLSPWPFASASLLFWRRSQPCRWIRGRLENLWQVRRSVREQTLEDLLMQTFRRYLDDLIWVPCFAKWSLTLRMTDSCHAFRCPAFIYNSTHGVRKRGQL